MKLQERTKMAFFAGERFDNYFPLLCEIARANEVELFKGKPDLFHNVAGVIYIEPTGCNHEKPSFLKGLPSFIIMLVSQGETVVEIRFSQSSKLPKLLKGRKVFAVLGLPIESKSPDGEILAEVQGVPVWTTRTENGVRHDVSIQFAPWITMEDRLFHHLNGQYLMRLLPLIEWMRAVSNWGIWEKPPVRATFMFDDPNLHASSYGFLSFKQLGDEARMHNFHTCLATVPLDGYYISKKASRILRENKREISLLFHGNNHTFRELAVGGSDNDCNSLVKEALIRIESLERRGGLKVAKVMAPPHGAIGLRMMKACARLGLEAVCVTWGSIWSSNKGQYWARLLGGEPGRIIEGLPVIPRFRMAREAKNQILLSAYLCQPIIPVGHHWDMADGIDLLRELSSFINALGEVHWGSMEEIVRSNFWWRIEGETLILKPFSRVMDFFVPEGIREIKIFEDWLKDGFKVTSQRVNSSKPRSFFCEKGTDGTWTISALSPCKIRVEAKVETETDNRESVPLKYPLKPLVRRLIAEGRDRLMPYLPKRLLKRLI